MDQCVKIIPHADIELGVQRQNIDCFFSIPERGLNNDTGLFVFVGGYAMKADSDYEIKMRKHIADKLNCICMGVNYYGIHLKGGHGNQFGFEINSKFTSLIKQCYNISPSEYTKDQSYNLSLLTEKLKKLGIAVVDSRCKLTGIDYVGSYLSFGFLPAIDILFAVGDMLSKFRINKRRIFIFGTSYGGYLALLASKFAPNTFSVVIDNSGFVRTRVNEIIDNNLDSFYLSHINFDGIYFPFIHKHPWTILDEYSPYYFSDSHRKIRSLLEETHFGKTASEYFIFHSTNDELIPIHEKDKFFNILKKYAKVHYKKITENDIDGRVFKDMSHGMNASLKGILDLVIEKNAFSGNGSHETDFDMDSNLIFICGDKQYVFRYSPSYELSVELSRNI